MTQKHFDAETLLHTNAFSHEPFYTQKLLHTNTLLHTTLLHTDTPLHTTLLHTDAFTHKLLHTDVFTHRRFYTQTPLRANASKNTFARKRGYTEDVKSQFHLSF